MSAGNAPDQLPVVGQFDFHAANNLSNAASVKCSSLPLENITRPPGAGDHFSMMTIASKLIMYEELRKSPPRPASSTSPSCNSKVALICSLRSDRECVIQHSDYPPASATVSIAMERQTIVFGTLVSAVVGYTALTFRDLLLTFLHS
jgi:hypothetical protein